MAKKLIEVALPLAEINDASAYDKMPGIGPHPKGIHPWWAALPLPSARAVLFASLVDDPASDPRFTDRPKAEVDAERERLFDIIRSLMQKKIHRNDDVFFEASDEIRRCCNQIVPTVLDPFCGGGAIPLEAQRLGLRSVGSDLNPVAVMVSKMKVEILPKFARMSPVNPQSGATLANSSAWPGATGVAEDLRYYSKLLLGILNVELSSLYPSVEVPDSRRVGEPIAWIWTRTIVCPNPACKARTPLVRSFILANRGNRKIWVEPRINHDAKTVKYYITDGIGDPPIRTVTRRGATCIFCRDRDPNYATPIPFAYIRAEGQSGRIESQLMAIVCAGPRGRIYVEPSDLQEQIANSALPSWRPDTQLVGKAAVNVPLYGLTRHSDLFTSRQLCALVTIGDSIKQLREQIISDALRAGMQDDKLNLQGGGRGATSYADTLQLLLAFCLDRCTDFNNALCTWIPSNEKVMHLFSRQGIAMVWDFAEANILSDSVGGWLTCANYVADCLEVTISNNPPDGEVKQLDASQATPGESSLLVSTDPPYYDNIAYADLSDFFYVWLRRTVSNIYPDSFSTILTPKDPELTASPYRFRGNATAAKEHFEQGFRKAFADIRKKLDPRFPMTVYYAMKQTEEEEDLTEGNGSVRTGTTTGWETLLESLLTSGFQITATWPLRASQKWRMVSMGANALASYIVLACRPRPDGSPMTTRREYINVLRTELPPALRNLQKGNIPPVDLAQAALGPGMSVFSRFSKVVETDGSAMTVRNALALINQVLDEVLAEQDSEYDPDTRWALAWFEQYAMNDGQYGDAETLSKSKNTSVQGLAEAGILYAKAGKVRLLDRDELNPKWDPATDKRVTVWEITQQLIHALDKKGEAAAATLLQKVGGLGEVARDLAYRLFTICERKGWAQEALAYNSLVVSWPQVKALASKTPPPAPGQVGMDI